MVVDLGLNVVQPQVPEREPFEPSAYRTRAVNIGVLVAVFGLPGLGWAFQPAGNYSRATPSRTKTAAGTAVVLLSRRTYTEGDPELIKPPKPR